MNILITHVYSRGNNGDAAILASLIAELKRVFDKPAMRISTMERAALHETFEGVPHVPSLISAAVDGRPPVRKMVSIGCSLVTTWLWAVWQRRTRRRADWLLRPEERRVLHAMADADMLVGVGGGYIQARPGVFGTIDLLLVLQTLYLAHVLGKPVALYTQSIGPFAGSLQARLAAYVLNRTRLIIVRESVTQTLLQRMHVHDRLIARAADAAFLLRKQSVHDTVPPQLATLRQTKGTRKPAMIIGVTARNWLAPSAQAAFERAMAKSLDDIVRTHHAHIVFIPQVTVARAADDDRLVQRRIFEAMQEQAHATHCDGTYNFHQVRAMYARMDYLIGNRFHSVIFALTAGVPAIAIEYEHKTGGIMADLGLRHWVIPMGKLTYSRLTQRFQKLVHGRAAYARHLESVLPAYVRSAETAADALTQLASTD